MDHLDLQMRQWAPRLRDDVRVTVDASNALATTMAGEVRLLPEAVKTEIRHATPVDLSRRIEELQGFQLFMDAVHSIQGAPAVTRAQVVVQNYICFVYLGDACFRILATKMPSGSATKRCCQFLTNNPVRAFRNAVAHGNWTYTTDFGGLRFWARKGSGPDEPLVEFEVGQNDLNFWQALARCTAYSAYTSLDTS